MKTLDTTKTHTLTISNSLCFEMDEIYKQLTGPFRLLESTVQDELDMVPLGHCYSKLVSNSVVHW